jgi:hypothetical protein
VRKYVANWEMVRQEANSLAEHKTLLQYVHLEAFYEKAVMPFSKRYSYSQGLQ